MQEELQSILFEAHRRVVIELLDEARQCPEVVGVLLIGSLARGNAVPGSDVDLLLLADGRSEEQPVRHEERQGLWVELHQRDVAWAKAQMGRDPEWLYAYLEGRILYDLEGELAWLTAFARHRFAAYHTPPADKARVAFMAERTRAKLQAALDAGDPARAGTIVGLGADAIVRLLWAAHDRPIVGPTNLWQHLSDLTDLPAALHGQVRALLLGDMAQRIGATIALCSWIVAYLGEPRQHEGQS